MWSNALCLLVLAFIASVVAQNEVREAPNDAMAQIMYVLILHSSEKKNLLTITQVVS